MRRKMLRMSQTKLGDALGLTFQQVQKYESGTNRIGASRLQQISQVLKVPISFFFEDPGGAAEKRRSPDFVSEFLITTDGINLSKAFTRITDPRIRRNIVKLVQAIRDEEA